VTKARPNEQQRKAISEKVTQLDAWRATCEEFATNSWNVRHIGNLLDNYQQRVKAKARPANGQGHMARAPAAPAAQTPTMDPERIRKLREEHNRERT
jgi:hypothetical protein